MPASAIGPGRTASLALILLLTATVLLPAASQPAHADVASASTYLTDRAWSQVANGWGPVESDRSNGEQAPGDGARLTLAGVGYDKGLGAHATSEVQVALDRSCTRFLAGVGVDDEVGANGSVIFKVYADDSKIFDSGVLRGSSATRSVDVDVQGVSRLRLVVTDAGDGAAYDHADWADARLACSTAPPVTPATAAQVNSEHSGAANTPLPVNAPERWAHTFPGGQVHLPLVVGDRAFVTVGYFSDPTDGWGSASRLVALDRRSGVQLWSVWLHDAWLSQQANTHFALATYGDGRVFAVNSTGTLQAFDAATGQNLWTTVLPDPASISSAPTAFGGRIYVYGYANSLGRVWSVNQSDGRIEWEFNSPWISGSNSSPTVVGDAVFVTGGCDQTYALRRTDGRVLWDSAGQCYGGGGATAVHHLGRLYSLSQRWDTTALVRDGSTGAEIERIPSIFQPVTGASTGYFGDGLRIEARDLATGGVRWTLAPQTRLRTQPLLANGVLYVGTESDELYGIDAATGALRSKRPLGSTPGASPYALLNAGEGVLLVPAGSRLVAFG